MTASACEVVLKEASDPGSSAHSIGQTPWTRRSSSFSTRGIGPSSPCEVLVGEPLVECPGPLAGGLEVVTVDHGGFEVVPLVGAAPGLPADEGVAGHEHDRRVQRGALQQAGEEHGAVDAVGRAVPERLAR